MPSVTSHQPIISNSNIHGQSSLGGVNSNNTGTSLTNASSVHNSKISKSIKSARKTELGKINNGFNINAPLPTPAPTAAQDPNETKESAFNSSYIKDSDRFQNDIV